MRWKPDCIDIACVVIAACLCAGACVSASMPLDAKAVGPSMRTEIAEHESFVIAIRDEITPGVDLALVKEGEGPAKAVLVALRDRLAQLNANPDDKIGRGRLLLLAISEALGETQPK